MRNWRWARRATFILAMFWQGCQTVDVGSENEKQTSVLESQKTVVRSALDIGKPEQALAALRPLIIQHPTDADLQTLMGFAQLALHNGTRAVKHFTLAYKLKPEVAMGLNLSSAYIEAGDGEKAIRLLQALVKKAARDKYQYRERIYHNLGYAAVGLGRLKEAESYLQQAVEENPSYVPVQLELARIYVRTQRPGLAQKAYQKAVDYCAVCYEPVQALTQIFLQQGRRAEATKLLLRFTKVEGAAPEDRNRAAELLSQVTTADLPRAARRIEVSR